MLHEDARTRELMTTTTTARPLSRILGLGFGLAFTFGSMVGVGILRLPGTVAAALGNGTLSMVFWIVGGAYTLMGAVAVAELAAMIPETGGFRVYARRAFGEGVGFAVGWVDWLCNVASLAYVAVTAVEFLGALWPAVHLYPRAAVMVILALFTLIHWFGLRLGSTLTKVISVAIGVMLMVLVVGSFLVSPASGAASVPLAASAMSHPFLSAAMLLAAVPALRSILLAYDGWYSPIYMAEENTDPARTLPRSIIGGTALVIAIYVVINLAFFHVLPLSVLATSELPAADVARIVLPRGGVTLVTVISLMTVLSLLNNIMLMAPRVLYAIGRDGLLNARTAAVSDGGTPRVALLATTVVVAVLVLSGSFNQLVALSAVLFLIFYVSAFLSMFVLRRREPALPRPYRAFGYPYTTGIVLVGSVTFLIAAMIEDPRSAWTAAIFLAACVPAYWWLSRGRRLRAAADLA
jgi:basic amino acid/polyamine antiporter, APA family